MIAIYRRGAKRTEELKDVAEDPSPYISFAGRGGVDSPNITILPKGSFLDTECLRQMMI